MKKIQRIVLSLALNFSYISNGYTEGFEQKVQQLIQDSLPQANIGILIQNPLNGDILFEKNSKQFFYPASNTKLLTSIAALKILGPQFQYQTRLHAALQQRDNHVLKGDVVLVFQGDPTFTTNDLIDLLAVLKMKGIKTIQGNIIIDDSAFKGPSYAPGWTWDSIPWYYSAPISSIIINENKTKLKLLETKKLYSLIPIEKTDLYYPYEVITQVKAVTAEDAKSRCRIDPKIKNNQIRLTGCWPMEYTPTVIEMALDNPRLYAAYLINHYLDKQKITLEGKIQFKQSSETLPAIAIKHSLPLKKLLYKVLAESNNIYTESLTKTIGHIDVGEGSFQQGTQSILKILSENTLNDYTQLPLSDGSGQSRYNLISPEILSQLLFYMYHDPLFPIFYQSLSVNGKNGTLQERMKEKSIIGKIAAKTGTATGTSTLSGYLTAKNGQPYIFSIMINNANQKYTKLKSLEDKFCQLLINEESLSTPQSI